MVQTVIDIREQVAIAKDRVKFFYFVQEQINKAKQQSLVSSDDKFSINEMQFADMVCRENNVLVKDLKETIEFHNTYLENLCLGYNPGK